MLNDHNQNEEAHQSAERRDGTSLRVPPFRKGESEEHHCEKLLYYESHVDTRVTGENLNRPCKIMSCLIHLITWIYNSNNKSTSNQINLAIKL